MRGEVGLVVYPETMRRNLGLSNGLIASEAVMMRLTKLMGRHEAHRLLYAAAQQSQSDGVPFLTAIREHPFFAKHELPQDLAQALEASAYVGESVTITIETVERVTGQR